MGMLTEIGDIKSKAVVTHDITDEDVTRLILIAEVS